MVLLTALSFVSCEKDGSGDPKKPVPDPEGTVLVSMRNENNGGGAIGLSIGLFIQIDKSDNFEVHSAYGRWVEIASVGEVSGLGNILSAPEQGWSDKVAVMPGYGYVVRGGSGNYPTDDGVKSYVRLYVVEWVTGTSGGIIGARVKYQDQFVPDNVPVQDTVQ